MTFTSRPARAAWVALVVLLVAPDFGCAQPTVRTLSRDIGAGGPAVLDLDGLTPMFDGAEAAEALAALDAGRGAAAVEWARAQEDGPHRAFVLGRGLHVDGQYEAALEPLAACAAGEPLLADHCLYWAADAAERIARYAEAERYASMVAEGATYGPRSRFLRARALFALGDMRAAADTCEAFLGDVPEAWYRIDVELLWAEALEESGERVAAVEAYERVRHAHPGTGQERRAAAAVERLAPQLSDEDRARIARSADALAVERAHALMAARAYDGLVAALAPVLERAAEGTEVFCDAQYLMGKTRRNQRQHDDAVPYFRSVIAHCDGDVRVWSLYNAGRSLWTRGHLDDALAHFEQLWTEHADHTYADDAMLLAARIHRERGDMDDAEAQLHAQIRSYPAGDMLSDAVWLRAQRLYEAGEHQAFVRFVDDVGTTTGESSVYDLGRLAYFRGRSLEALGLLAEARGAYERVAREHPMGWYALLALNRLTALGAEDMAVAVMTSTPQREAASSGAIEIRPQEVALDPSYRRGLLLLRLGQPELAEREFGALADRYPNEDELGWVLSALYAHVGAYDRSHRVPGAHDQLALGYPNAANRARWAIAYPTPWRDEVEASAAREEISPWLIYAIMRQESGFRPDAISRTQARGLLQLMEGTAGDMARRTGRGSVSNRELFDPAINIELGAAYLGYLSGLFDEHMAVAIPSYNAGQGNVNRWLRSRGDQSIDLWVENIPFTEARRYAKSVTIRVWAYTWLYGGGAGRLVELPLDVPPPYGG